MKKPDTKSLYRQGVGGLIFNANGELFLACRYASTPPVWQFPQGGIDNNETAEAAFVRELEEETGIAKPKIIATLPSKLRYILPVNYRKRFTKEGYIGQELQWFLAYFSGSDQEIDLQHHDVEFSSWKWIRPEQLESFPLASYKLANYREVIKQFLPVIKHWLKEIKHG